MSYFEKKSEVQDGLGNDVTSTTIGPKQALDVNVANTVEIPVVIAAYVQATGHWRSTISASITPVILIPIAVPRKQVVICNRSHSNLYVSFSAILDSTHFDLIIPRNGYYESPPYLLISDWYGVWDTADGFATVSSIY